MARLPESFSPRNRMLQVRVLWGVLALSTICSLSCAQESGRTQGAVPLLGFGSAEGSVGHRASAARSGRPLSIDGPLYPGKGDSVQVIARGAGPGPMAAAGGTTPPGRLRAQKPHSGGCASLARSKGSACDPKPRATAEHLAVFGGVTGTVHVPHAHEQPALPVVFARSSSTNERNAQALEPEGNSWYMGVCCGDLENDTEYTPWSTRRTERAFRGDSS
jgi:hypothetical protein